MKRVPIIAALIVGILVGLSAGWWFGVRSLDGETDSLILTFALGDIALCAGVLGIDDADHSDKTRLVLEQYLESSLSQANRLLAAGVTIEEAIPNLREGVRRAVIYAGREAGSSELQRQAEEVQRLLEAGRDLDVS